MLPTLLVLAACHLTSAQYIFKHASEGVAQPGAESVLYETIPRYIKLKYKLIQWFENRKMCPLRAPGEFPAWEGYKKVMAASPAITTPDEGVAGNRTLSVKGFCSGLQSKDFQCVRTKDEIKLHTETGKVTAGLDGLTCTMQDISIYKMADGFVGVRFDFGTCAGGTRTGPHAFHTPKSAVLNMELGGPPPPPPTGSTSPPTAPPTTPMPGPAVPPTAPPMPGPAVPPTAPPMPAAQPMAPPMPGAQPTLHPRSMQPNPRQMSAPPVVTPETGGFDAFFGAVCGGGAVGAVQQPNVVWDPRVLPKMNPQYAMWPTMRSTPALPACFAHSAEASHVIGKGCYEDFLWFDLQDAFGAMAKIPSFNRDAIIRTIPGVQSLPHPHGRVMPAAGHVIPAAPASPCAPVAGRRLGPCDPSTVPPTQPPTTEPCAPVTPAPPPPPPAADCSEYKCPAGWHPWGNAASVLCKKPSGCGPEDLYTCCHKGDQDVPGVVIADRVCVYFEGCVGCDNACNCYKKTPISPSFKTTTVNPNPAHPEFCHDCWIQNAIIAVVAWYFCFRQCIVNCLKGYLMDFQPRGYRRKHKRATAWGAGNAPAGSIASTALGGAGGGGIPAGGFTTAAFMADQSGDSGVPGQSRTIAEIEEVATYSVMLHAFFWFFFIVGIIVHLVWLLFWLVVTYAFQMKDWDQNWNCIFIWKCPFALVPVWIAIWLMLWLQAWSLAFYYKESLTTETKGRRTETTASAYGGGGGGGGSVAGGVVAGTLASLGLGGGGGGGAAYGGNYA